MNDNNVHVRPIERSDIPTLVRLLNLAADFQDDSGAVAASTADLDAGFFGAIPYVYGLFAERSGRVVGLATYYFKYSTYKGRPVLYLEDLFVDESVRGQGVGKALMYRLADVARELRCTSIEWITPSAESNEALRFYRRIGGVIVDKAQPFDVCTMRLDEEGLAKLT